ncbi:MAG: ribbon-helix-helix domain-containing protein [archaeon]|nr:ribbon-helix-helix domain-containing protein [archaeon]
MVSKDSVPILVHFPKKVIASVDKLVRTGHYASRTEAIRDAVRIRINILESGGEKLTENDADKKLEQILEDYINDDPHKRLRKLGL